MAITTNVVRRSNDEVEVDFIATLDADTASTAINHGLGLERPTIALVPLLQVPASLSLWAVTTLDGTQLVLTKAITAGSGNAGVQLRVILKRAR